MEGVFFVGKYLTFQIITAKLSISYKNTEYIEILVKSGEDIYV